MALYAVGDVQGCYDSLRHLLDHLGFEPERDRLWFTGDLVNRGPDSARVLRFVRDLGEGAVTVLGNHDLHLLAVAAGAAQPRSGDTLEGLLRAPDREALLDWLRHRPLLHYEAPPGRLLVHAGLLPQWDLDTARSLAAEVEAELRGPGLAEFLEHLYGDEPDRWQPGLRGPDRFRVVVNAMTRLRFCDADGHMRLGLTGPPGSQPPGLMPWFRVPGRRIRCPVVFGHWSALGAGIFDGVIALDSGCVWGGGLSAVRLDAHPPRFYRVPCAQTRSPAQTISST